MALSSQPFSVTTRRLSAGVRWLLCTSVCVAACSALLAVPMASSASSVTLRPQGPPTQGEPPSGADVLYFEAASGERNVVSAQFAWEPREGTWTITDSEAVLDA